jgi:hypothetical protein
MDLKPRLALVLGHVDYVNGFQALATVGSQLKRIGRRLPLLLQKATLELGVGSYEAARQASLSAIDLSPHCAEAHWLHGMSLLGLLLVDLGLLTEGPGEAKPKPEQPPLEQLIDVRQCLLRCAALGAGQDQEASDLVAFFGTVLAARPSKCHLRNELRCLL